MLLLLSAGLLIGSAFTLIVRRNRESALLAVLCLSLIVYLTGLMLLIAKQGRHRLGYGEVPLLLA